MNEEEDNPERKKSNSDRMREVVDKTRQKLRKIRGEVFHVIAGDDQLIRFKVDPDGNLNLDRQFRGLNLHNIVNMPKRMMEAGKEAKERVVEAGKEAKGRARRKFRKVVTGDPEKRIRDHMKEVPQVKMIDKLSFTFGVLSICGLEWLALRHGDCFPYAYYIIMTLLLGMRFYLYKQDKYEMFMLDFCYFMNISVMLQTALFPDNLLWFKANYVMSLGPLMIAIIIWKNSLVFHSLDKLTSFYLHAMPPLTLHLFRFGFMKHPMIHPEDSLSFVEIFVVPLSLYLCWQMGYFFVTEVILATRLAEDKDLITSLRYLANDKKNGFRNLIIKILISLGVHREGDPFDPDSTKAKVVFGTSQLIYTIITILPTPFLYSSYQFSVLYFVFVFGWGTWNGASYYIEVFSERYKLQFIKVESTEKSDADDSKNGEDTEEEDLSEFESFEEALEQMDPTEQTKLYETILAMMNEEQIDSEDKKEDEEVYRLSKDPVTVKSDDISKDASQALPLEPDITKETVESLGTSLPSLKEQPKKTSDLKAADDTSKVPAADISKEVAADPVKEAAEDTSNESAVGTSKKSAVDPPKEGAVGPLKKSAVDPSKEAAASPTMESAADQSKEAAAGSSMDAAASIEKQNVPETSQEMDPATKLSRKRSVPGDEGEIAVEQVDQGDEVEDRPTITTASREDSLVQYKGTEEEECITGVCPETVSKLLEEAATTSVGKRSTSSSEGTQETPESEKSWDDLAET